MTNSSILKCILALSITSVYIWLFGISGYVGADAASKEETLSVNTERDIKPPVADNTVDDSGVAEEAAFNPMVTAVNQTITAEVTIYDTTIDVSRPIRAGFADLPAQTTAERYYSTEEEPATSVATTAPDTTTAPEETTTTPPTESTTSESVTTTSAETNVTTTTPRESTNASGTLTVFDTREGKNVTASAKSIVARIVQNEIGSGFEKEAIKAMCVAAYTYSKLYADNGQIAQVRLAAAASDRVVQCAEEVEGEAIYYGNSLIQAVYYASSAGHTASSVNVWGQDIPYLRSVECPLDSRFDPNYGLTKSFSSDDIMARVLEKTGVRLEGDPTSWLEITSYTDTVYVGNMRVGGYSSYTKDGKTVDFTGKTFRDIMGTTELRSAAFGVNYDKSRDTFTFTTYGYGHGVGLSQNGANALAKYEGYDYKQILKFYFNGTEIY
ncbi:MAG: SpoIID/LytB domain-containing protein [Oscillospiraceae bacterium]|jgi:stage II sporulation protein D|nr:SpoIID/LytB domain-containing protein [Oscillospiraceae bacterium]